MDLDFCIICMKQTMGGLYCSSKCRAEDYAKAFQAASSKSQGINIGKNDNMSIHADIVGYRTPRYDSAFSPSFNSYQYPDADRRVRPGASFTNDLSDASSDDTDSSWDATSTHGQNISESVPKTHAISSQNRNRRHNSKNGIQYQSLADIEPCITQPLDTVPKRIRSSSTGCSSAASKSLQGILHRHNLSVSASIPRSVGSWFAKGIL